MKTLVLGVGIIGVSTAWHLLQRGHDVTVVDRQPDAAMETSFANAAQISVSYCEPWANREAPLKALKWMLSKEAPLLFRPRLPLGEGWQQWRWGLQVLANCNGASLAISRWRQSYRTSPRNAGREPKSGMEEANRRPL